MPGNPPSTPFCVEFHDAIRLGAPEGSLRQLGSGLPERPGYPHLKPLLTGGLAHLFDSGSVASFGLGADDAVAEELRRSLAHILRDPLTYDHLLPTAGVSDGLASLFDFCGEEGIGIVLPLPCYFGYELAALRSRARIAGYHDLATGRVVWRDRDGPLCLVINTPDAISGYSAGVEELCAVESELGQRLQLTAIDLVCAMQRHPVRVGSASIEDLWKGSNAPARAVLFGVTKDLALPGLRAGLLVIDDLALMARIRAGVLARSFSAGVFVSMVMALYLRLLASIEGCPPGGVRSEVFPGLTDELITDFLDDRSRVALSFDRARAMLEQDVPGLRVPSSAHHAGYSTLATVADPVRDVTAVIAAARQLLADGLKVNPTYMFGGDPALWNELRPGELHLRVNLSTPPDDLRRDAVTAVQSMHA